MIQDGTYSANSINEIVDAIDQTHKTFHNMKRK